MKKLFNTNQRLSLLAFLGLSALVVVGCTSETKNAPSEETAEAPVVVEESAPVAENTAPEPAVAPTPAPVAATPPPAPAPVIAASTKPEVQTLAPNDPRSLIYMGSDGTIKGTGDPLKASGSLNKFTAGSHAKALTLPGMPKDKFGLVDWMKMADDGIISPAGSLDVNKIDVPPFDMSVVIKAKGDFVKDVMFNHKTHTYWLSCEICHTGIFQMAKGSNHMTMKGIVEGKWCGRCHGKVSFPLADCNRCHVKEKH